jgi:LmbE family N-acetylglucosaminyl deacetylase
MPVAIVAAHPDDEILGLGLLLSDLQPQCAIVHVTDGAPRAGDDVRNAGCATWQEYAALRRRELQQALATAGVPESKTVCLDCPDQQAIYRVADHATRLAAFIDELRPSAVFTHAYEGGHPDHDATAAAVHAAFCLLKRPCALTEFAGYHAGAAGMECECFLPNGPEVRSRPLTPGENRRKREMLNSFASQSRVLAQFPLRNEPLRLAPKYDFARPPHEGRVYYDNFDWGVHSAEWRELAQSAFRDLGIPCVC